MDINKEAEQLLKDIAKLSDEIAWRLGTGTLQSDFLRAKELKKERLDLILQSFEKVCREQRRVDFHRVQIVVCISKRQIDQLKKIESTPLLTDKE